LEGIKLEEEDDEDDDDDEERLDVVGIADDRRESPGKNMALLTNVEI